MTSTPTLESAFLAVLSGTAVFLLIMLGDSLVTACGTWARDRVARGAPRIDVLRDRDGHVIEWFLVAEDADDDRPSPSDAPRALSPVLSATQEVRHDHAGRDHRTARRYHRIDGPRRRTAHPGE